MTLLKRTRSLAALSLLLGVCLSLSLPNVSALLPWVDWKTAAVGDISEASLPNYWQITSTPMPGYEGNLWSTWESVVESQKSYSSNADDKELVFTTTSSSSFMGAILFESKAYIMSPKDLKIIGNVGCKFTYAGVRTLAAVELYCVTNGTTVWSETFQSGPTANTWKWDDFASKSLKPELGHSYVIRLKGFDSWNQQKVEVAFESVDVWFHTPYTRTLSHGVHDWRTDYEYIPSDPPMVLVWHIYECTWSSQFKFWPGAIDDMVRDHRPYVTTYEYPANWDPCYVHEFRSYPYNALEGDEYYLTDLPGTVGITDSSDWEEQRDTYEEIEVYTRNPELLEAWVQYSIDVRYQVWATGSVKMVIESELVNEADRAWMSPPGWPVAYMELADQTVSHQYRSWLEVYYSPIQSTVETLTEPVAASVPEISTDYFREYSAVSIAETPGGAIRAQTKFNIDSAAEYREMLRDIRLNTEQNLGRLDRSEAVRATVLFDRLLSPADVTRMSERFGFEVASFRFTVSDGDRTLRGGGVARQGGVISLDSLYSFIDGYDLLGIQSVDVLINPGSVALLAEFGGVAAVDISAYLSLLDAGIAFNDLREVQWYVDDPSWFMN